MNEHIADPFRAILNAFAHPTEHVAAILNAAIYPPAPVFVSVDLGDGKERTVVQVECAVCLGARFDDEGHACVACSNNGYITTERTET